MVENYLESFYLCIMGFRRKTTSQEIRGFRTLATRKNRPSNKQHLWGNDRNRNERRHEKTIFIKSTIKWDLPKKKGGYKVNHSKQMAFKLSTNLLFMADSQWAYIKIA